jgi:HEAT repeat protein
MKALRYVVCCLVLSAVISVGVAAVGQAATLLAPAGKLVEKLASASSDERKEAREGLLALGAAAVPPLILATESKNALLRWEAVNLLGALRDLRATDAVLQVAISDPDVHARWRANWAVTCLNDGTVVPCLIAALDGEDPAIAWNAAITLSLFDRQEAVPRLHEGLQASGWQQWEAVNALGRVWTDETSSKLIVVLEEGSEDVRKEAALSLGRIGGDAALRALLGALQSDSSAEVRWRAAMMIGRIGDEETAELLMEIGMREVHPLVIEQINEAIEALTSSTG